MKQHITKEQWRQVTNGNKIPEVIYNQLISSTKYSLGNEISKYITIGFMIEFLGDDWYDNNFVTFEGYPSCVGILLIDNKGTDFDKIELADALWEAVKYKLKNL